MIDAKSAMPVAVKEIGETRGTFSVSRESIASDRHPERNEDAMFVRERSWGVCDGVGGHSDGKVASEMAANYLTAKIGTLPEKMTTQEAVDGVAQALVGADQIVNIRAREMGNDMATTASVVVAYQDERGRLMAIVGNVGDSRVYLMRGQNLEQITLDDNMASALAKDETEARQRQFRFNNTIDPERQLAEEERGLFKQRNRITQSIGNGKARPRIYAIELQQGDRLILCSDGVSDNLTDNEIAQIAYIRDGKSAARITRAALEKSRQGTWRSKPDDISTVVVDMAGRGVVSNREDPRAASQERGARFWRPRAGEVVTVQRSSGEMESGWVVEKVENGETVVSRRLPDGRVIEKKIPETRLRGWNAAEESQRINRLFAEMVRNGAVTSRSGTYTPEVLIDRANRILQGKAETTTMTRENGYRQRIEELIAARG